MKGVKRFTVIHTGVGHAAAVMELGVFRADSWIIETGRNGMRRYYLTIRILQNVGERSVQNTGPPARKTRSVVTQCGAAAARLDPDHLNLLVFNKVIEEAYRIATATDTCHKHIGQARFLFQNLRPYLSADDRLEVANHKRIRVGSQNRTQHVICRPD